MTLREAAKAVAMQIKVVIKRIKNKILRSTCQRLSKEYQEMARENPKFNRVAKNAAANPINPNSQRVTDLIILKSAPSTLRRLI